MSIQLKLKPLNCINRSMGPAGTGKKRPEKKREKERESKKYRQWPDMFYMDLFLSLSRGPTLFSFLIIARPVNAPA